MDLSENIKLDIIKVITSPGYFSNSKIKLLTIDERVNNVYREFSITRIGSQFTIFPYVFLRFNCELIVRQLC